MEYPITSSRRWIVRCNIAADARPTVGGIDQRFDQCFESANLQLDFQLHAPGLVVLDHSSGFKSIQHLVDGAKLIEINLDADRATRQDFNHPPLLEALGRAAAVGAHQTTSAQFDATKIASHQDHDMVQTRALDGRINRPAGSAGRLAVICKPVGLIDLVGPAIVTGVCAAVLLNKGKGLIDAVNAPGVGQETALFDLFGKMGIRSEGEQILVLLRNAKTLLHGPPAQQFIGRLDRIVIHRRRVMQFILSVNKILN